MALQKEQMDKLAEAFDAWDESDLQIFADVMDFNLANETATIPSLRGKAFKFISTMNGRGRGRELLQRLLREDYESTKNAACALLQPKYISTRPNSAYYAAYYAIALGKTPFLGRDELRERIPDFMEAGLYSTRVLVVRGRDPCGKSYTYYFLQHLADNAGARFTDPLNVAERNPSAREFFAAVGRKLGINLLATGFPTLADDPQQSKLKLYLDWLEGQLDDLNQAYWLTIDELNHPQVTQAAKDAAFALAKLAESKKGHLWVALLGYNDPITDPKFTEVVQETAVFPGVSEVIIYFERLAEEGELVLEAGEAREWAEALFPAGATIDKEFMENTRRAVEQKGACLLRGVRPA